MKKILTTRLLIFLLLGTISQVAMGQNQDSDEYTVLSQTQSDDAITYEVSDSKGNRFKVTTPVAITPTQELIVRDVVDKIYAIPNLTIDTLKILFKDDKASIHILPSSYVLRDLDEKGGEEIEVSQYMTSGMQFYYTTYLEYNFRMFIENLFVRIQGQFFSTELFEEKLIEAVDNPAAYIQAHDPEFIIRKLTAIDMALDKQRAEYSELSENFDKVRFGLMMLHNRGWFGKINDIDQNMIAKLIELKTADSSLTMKDAAEKMKEAGMAMRKNEIFLVFAIYFNEFE